MTRLLFLLAMAMLSAASFSPTSARAQASTPIPVVARTPLQIQAAKDFELDGIHLWMKKAELTAAFPELKPLPALDNAKKDLAGWQIAKTPNTDGMELTLWSGRVTQVLARANPERVRALGGTNGVLSQLTALFGPPTASSAAIYEWKIEDASFTCKVVFASDGTVITFGDTGLLNEGIFARPVQK